jgi:UDP-glucuronate 4-epimerase
MLETSADVSAAHRDFGWTPKVSVEEGIPKFVDWFRTYNRL